MNLLLAQKTGLLYQNQGYQPLKSTAAMLWTFVLPLPCLDKKKKICYDIHK